MLTWLTGYDEAGGLDRAVAAEVDLETFFAQAPGGDEPGRAPDHGRDLRLPRRGDHRPFMQKVRWADKLVDELARGKKMTSILRGEKVG